MVQKSGESDMVVYSICSTWFLSIPGGFLAGFQPSTVSLATLGFVSHILNLGFLEQLCWSSFWKLNISVWTSWSQHLWMVSIFFDVQNFWYNKMGPKTRKIPTHNSTKIGVFKSGKVTSYPFFKAIYKCFVWLRWWLDFESKKLDPAAEGKIMAVMFSFIQRKLEMWKRATLLIFMSSWKKVDVWRDGFWLVAYCIANKVTHRIHGTIAYLPYI